MKLGAGEPFVLARFQMSREAISKGWVRDLRIILAQLRSRISLGKRSMAFRRSDHIEQFPLHLPATVTGPNGQSANRTVTGRDRGAAAVSRSTPRGSATRTG